LKIESIHMTIKSIQMKSMSIESIRINLVTTEGVGEIVIYFVYKCESRN
jgi:hypothetical protein